MRKNRFRWAVGVALATFVAVLLPASAGAAPSATISGTVAGSGFAPTDLWVGTWTDADEMATAQVHADGSYSLTVPAVPPVDVADPAHPSSYYLVLYVGNPDPNTETGSQAQHSAAIGWVGVKAGKTTTKNVGFTKVAGTVTSAGSGSPLSNTSVAIRSTDAKHTFDGFTDTSGTYAALAVVDNPATTYTALFDPLDDNVRQYFGGTTDHAHATRFALDTTTVKTIDITLPVAAHLKGVLKLAKGGTYVDGTIVLYKTTTRTTSAPDYSFPGIVLPQHPSYELGGIAPGTYRIAFGRARGSASAPGHFYDATPEAAVKSSTVVTLVAGTTTRLKTQYGSPRLAGKVSGRIVRTVKGRTVGRHGLQVVARPLNSHVSPRTTRTNAHGYFVIPGLAPGAYHVYVWNSYNGHAGSPACVEKRIATARVAKLHTTPVGSRRFTATYYADCSDPGAG